MKNPIPGIDSFAQEEAQFDAKRKKVGPKRPYPRVYGVLYKGPITTDGFDTRVKVCDVQTPIESLKDCSPKCFSHPDRDSQGIVREGKMVRRKWTTFWRSACAACLADNDRAGVPVRRHA